MSKPFNPKTKVEFSEINLKLESKGLKDGKYHGTGLLSTTDADFVNDIFTKDCIKSIVNQINGKSVGIFMKDSSKKLKVNLDHEHLTEDSRIIPRAKIDKAEYIEDAAKPDWAGARIDTILNSHLPDFGAISGSIEDGFLDSFSIEFKPTKRADILRDGKKYRVVDDVIVGGAAFTGRPVNQSCSITDFGMKSSQLMEEDDINNKMEECKMEETKKEIVEEVKAKVEVDVTAPLKQELEAKNKEIAELKKSLEEMKSQTEIVSKVTATIKDEMKALQPEKKVLADANEKKFEQKSKPYTLAGQISKQGD
jgi:hypothetical protein